MGAAQHGGLVAHRRRRRRAHDARHPRPIPLGPQSDLHGDAAGGDGLGLLVPNAMSALAVVTMLAALELQVRAVEEPYLVRSHGPDYRRWAAQLAASSPASVASTPRRGYSRADAHRRDLPPAPRIRSSATASTTWSRRRASRGTRCASATSAGPSASGSARSTTRSGSAHFARFEPLPDNLPRPLALRYHGHQFRAYNPHARRRPRLPLRAAARRRRRPPARSRHQGQRADAVVARRRRTADAQGRRARGAGDRDARGARRLTSKSFSLFETGEALHARRRAVADALVGAGAARPLAHPLRHASSASRYRGDARAASRRLVDYSRRALLARALAERRRHAGRASCARSPRAARRSAPAGWPRASCTACSTPTT